VPAIACYGVAFYIIQKVYIRDTRNGKNKYKELNYEALKHMQYISNITNM
jgi:hypothetical protein